MREIKGMTPGDLIGEYEYNYEQVVVGKGNEEINNYLRELRFEMIKRMSNYKEDKKSKNPYQHVCPKCSKEFIQYPQINNKVICLGCRKEF